MMSFYDDLGATRKGIVGEAWFWIAVTLTTVGLISAVVFGIRWATAPTKGKLAAREQIQSGSYRIAAYDHFFDLCASVQATEAALAATYVEIDSAPADDLERLRTNATGLTAQRARSVATYNADARKSYTLGQFRASDLPYYLPATYEKGATTTCGS